MHANEYVPLTHVYLLPMENLFHPIFDINVDEDVRRIAITLPSLVVNLLPDTLDDHQFHNFT